MESEPLFIGGSSWPSRLFSNEKNRTPSKEPIFVFVHGTFSSLLNLLFCSRPTFDRWTCFFLLRPAKHTSALLVKKRKKQQRGRKRSLPQTFPAGVSGKAGGGGGAGAGGTGAGRGDGNKVKEIKEKTKRYVEDELETRRYQGETEPSKASSWGRTKDGGFAVAS